MTGVLAVPAGGRVVVVCCGGHRPGGKCLCCLECPADPATVGADYRLRLARVERERAAALRLALRRAFHAVCVAAVEDHLRPLAAATDAAVLVLTPDLPHLEGSL